MIRELIEKIASGEWSPRRPIEVPMYEGGSQQIRMVPLESQVRLASHQGGIHPLKLYHMIQRKIYEDMLDRVDRSRIFKAKVFSILCDWEGECQLVEMFDDPIDEEFDYDQYKNDRDLIASYQKNMNRYEEELESNAGQGVDRKRINDLQSECDGCMHKLNDHREILLGNLNQYDPNYMDVWTHMATKGDSYYRDDIQKNPDPKYQAFANKQIDRVIPRNIQDVFLNATLIPILMKQENRMLLKSINELYASLQEDAAKLKYLIRQIPESDEPSQKSLIESIFEGLGFEESKSDESTLSDEEDPPTSASKIAEQVKSIVEDSDDEDDAEDEEDDEDADDEDEDDSDEEKTSQKGGLETHVLTFF